MQQPVKSILKTHSTSKNDHDVDIKSPVFPQLLLQGPKALSRCSLDFLLQYNYSGVWNTDRVQMSNGGGLFIFQMVGHLVWFKIALTVFTR